MCVLQINHFKKRVFLVSLWFWSEWKLLLRIWFLLKQSIYSHLQSLRLFLICMRESVTSGTLESSLYKCCFPHCFVKLVPNSPSLNSSRIEGFIWNSFYSMQFLTVTTSCSYSKWMLVSFEMTALLLWPITRDVLMQSSLENKHVFKPRGESFPFPTFRVWL